MRTIEYASAFKRDYKRIKATPKHKDIDTLLESILLNLANDQALLESQRDHSLNGVWVSYRECHIKPDLLLIYRKPDEETLQLARLGSHSELFR
ncbi:MAG: type II toxin-antitoxin system YafQ family toxin [Methylovulum miyakonense]|uniref:type II toxin-antitoxin system YafQ family toxin n=1 Tax=Methylovulum miyakonense TaxID=645578 RepID=UPI003BB6D8D1